MPIDDAAPPPSVDIVLPDKLVPVFAPPRGAVAGRGAFGGRGSAKSYNFALMAAVFGYAEPLRILCTREFQASIRESFHAELRDVILSRPFLADHYDVGVEYIRGRNGTEFFFRGLRQSMNAIKSMAHVDLTVVEEAEDVPEHSWETLLPTVMRQPKAEVWKIWNPRDGGSPVDKRYRVNVSPDELVVEMGWRDNPFFPAGLDRLRRRDEELLDAGTYDWIWEGAYRVVSNVQVFNGKLEVREFEPGPDWNGPFQGGDWGFSQDPTAATRSWEHDGCLYVEHEAGRTGLELDETAKFVIDAIPGFDQYVSRWDNARPESISMVKRNGLPKMEAVVKWPGSVEDGVKFMRSYRRIVVHPRCTQTATEFRRYSHKVNASTGDVMPAIVDAYNHYIDSIRYALAPLIRMKATAKPRLRVL